MKLTHLLDDSCEDCYDPVSLGNYMRTVVFVGSDESINASSAEGQALIGGYNISFIPTVLLTGDLEPYEAIGFKEFWEIQFGTKDGDAYVFRNTGFLGDLKYTELGQ